ncbi:hypothetical protein [Helicobacter cappadocius]|uniref:Uncharacterized protein n=1 Tax=Helicobacter cappadocius TaxID=3063998 RepID=A0AA90TC17_9HELI|nr:MULTISPECIES: hypothetical protein [unclassified Helicobacter]MDO7253449.1 hypothetical protein [Helicobacter sp. faydin-H75]MDP2539376.1 hypothetical protein [Helicobacter sp. faydin-H76]
MKRIPLRFGTTLKHLNKSCLISPYDIDLKVLSSKIHLQGLKCDFNS